jgi:hypothetical protein
MIELIKVLIEKWACMHDWKCISKTEVFINDDDKIPAYNKYLFCCKKCGKFKRVKSH